MPVWKKSEDPWDIDPNQRRTAPEPEEKEPGLLDSLREDWDAMQAARQEKREKLRLREGHGAGVSHGRQGCFLVSRYSYRKGAVDQSRK